MVFRPNEIVLIKSLFKDIFTYTVCAAGICVGITAEGGVVSESEELGEYLCCLPAGCAAGATLGYIIANLRSGPHLNRSVQKDERRYLQCLPKISPHSLYYDHVPAEIKTYIQQNNL
jgi:hypothetical protein